MAVSYTHLDVYKRQAHTWDDLYQVKYKLYELEEILPGHFMRVSKSTILNLQKIYALHKTCLLYTSIECSGDVPYTRGLGSSSTCIVAGIVGAYAFMDRSEERQEILELATPVSYTHLYVYKRQVKWYCT